MACGGSAIFSLAVPILSFHLLEVPLGRLKRFLRYPYAPTPAVRQSPTVLGAANPEPAALGAGR